MPKYLSLVFLFIVSSLFGQVIVYDQPGNIEPSERYSVSVEQNDSIYSPFVYITRSPGTDNAPPGHTTSFTTFSFSGQIKVTVGRKDGNPISNCIIRPKIYGIEPQIEGSTVSFIIDRPRKVSVEFEQDMRYINVDGHSIPIVKHSMLVFADSLETDIPDSNDENVIYFNPGVHSIGRHYKIPNNKTVYVAGGAYLIGNILTDGGFNINLRGRGIISGEDHTEIRKYHLLDFRNSTSITVDGITLIETPNYNLVMTGSNHHVKNVKMISWYGQTDGVDAARNSIIEDCFLKVNDDAVKLYHSNSIVRNNIIWIQRTGAPFQFTWNMGGEIENVHVYDNDVIHAEWEVEHLNRGIFSSIGGGDAHLHHYKLEDIRIEGHVWRLIYLQMRKTVWSPQPDYGEIDHIFFNNIQIEGPVLFKSIIRGATDDYGSQNVHYYHDIYMDSLMVNGECMTRDDFIIDDNTTYNIQVGCGYFEPTINIHRPKNHSAYDYGSDIEVAVSASAYKGKIDNVELYIDDTLVRKSYSAPHLWGTNYGDSLLSRLRPGFYDFKVIAEDTAGTFVEKIVNVTVKNELPENWNITDIGELPYKGISILSDSGFIMSSPGKSLGALRDEFHYLFQRKNGDSEIIAFINNFTCDYEWAKLGLMIREELDPGSRHATIGITPQNGSFFTSRAFPNSFSNQYVPNDEEEVPVWLKMTRMGNNFSGYTSFDGLNWIKISEAEIEMSDNVYIGIALAGKDENDPALAYIDSVFVEGGPVSVEYWQEDMIPNEIKLYQNYPNPFNPTTNIKYSIPIGAQNVMLKVFDVLGRQKAILVNENLKGGKYEVSFDGSNLASGIYYYQLTYGNYSESRKMILLK